MPYMPSYFGWNRSDAEDDLRPNVKSLQVTTQCNLATLAAEDVIVDQSPAPGTPIDPNSTKAELFYTGPTSFGLVKADIIGQQVVNAEAAISTASGGHATMIRQPPTSPDASLVIAVQLDNPIRIVLDDNSPVSPIPTLLLADTLTLVTDAPGGGVPEGKPNAPNDKRG